MMERQIQLGKAMRQKIQLERMKADRYRLKMNYLHPGVRLREQQQLCVEYEQRLRFAMEKKLTANKQKLAIRIERMKGLSPLTKLNQGFSYVTDASDRTVKSVQDIRKEDKLTIYVTDGIVKARVEDTIQKDTVPEYSIWEDHRE